MRARFIILLTAGLAMAETALAGDRCAVCGEPFGALVYFFDDKVTGEKKEVCERCAHLSTICFLCGLPAKSDFKELPDGRILCARDVKTVVLDAGETRQVFNDVAKAMERQFARFMTFPENVEVQPLDRVDLMAMYRLPGFDEACPNVWGCTLPRTNGSRVVYIISLLQGLPAYQLKATSAHELTHTWIVENVPPARKTQLDRDSVEGFCELLSFLYVEVQNDAAAMGVIKSNGYTRGQFDVLLEAERRYGFNDVVEWVKYGVDPRLASEDLGRVRNIEMPARPSAGSAATAESAVIATTAVAPPQFPDKLTLKGISGTGNRRFALINDKTFATADIGKVRVGETNLLIRCLEIRTNSALIQIENSGEKQELLLGAP